MTQAVAVVNSLAKEPFRHLRDRAPAVLGDFPQQTVVVDDQRDELLGELMMHLPFRFGATKKAAEGMDKLAKAIHAGGAISDIFAEPYAFPRALYIAIANANWNRTAKANGLQPSDLYRRL